MKKLLRILLVPYEALFSRLNTWYTIPHSDEKIFLINMKKYKGEDFKLSDLTVTAGDKVGQLHVNNIQAKDLQNSIKNLNRIIDYELNKLAQSLNKEHKGVKAFFCETLFYPLLSRKGFECFDLPNNFGTKVKAFWFSVLKYTFSDRKNPSKRKRKPKLCWISAITLNQRLNSIK